MERFHFFIFILSNSHSCLGIFHSIILNRDRTGGNQQILGNIQNFGNAGHSRFWAVPSPLLQCLQTASREKMFYTAVPTPGLKSQISTTGFLKSDTQQTEIKPNIKELSDDH